MADIATVVQSYADYLHARSEDLYDKFAGISRSDFEAATAEAITFGLLQQCNAAPEVADMVSVGGPDFLCLAQTNDKFKVEATSFTPETFSQNTGLPNKPPEHLECGAFGLLTQQIDLKVKGKWRQLQKAGMPTVLAIASNHHYAPLVLDSKAALNALISQPYWNGGLTRMSVNFSASAFLRQNAGGVETKNKALSAIIFIAIRQHDSLVCGALHPDPSYKMNAVKLYQIPFVYLKDWPIENDVVRPEWTLGNTGHHRVPHAAIRLSMLRA